MQIKYMVIIAGKWRKCKMERTVTISKVEYADLLESKGRLNAAASYAKAEQYPSRDVLIAILTGPESGQGSERS